ncbi:hypothetical protein AB205_0074920 [Aquarana catesbeiana]|uniref:Uncharacterized protein n=1 Tax=Aquarana catesbeiana TaxID=8400 RepID=A0A2G9P9K8_AQUCT|nr:hypothetical protein AB205_0074920 [Aquarana catesbeiana]
MEHRKTYSHFRPHFPTSHYVYVHMFLTYRPIETVPWFSKALMKRLCSKRVSRL